MPPGGQRCRCPDAPLRLHKAMTADALQRERIRGLPIADKLQKSARGKEVGADAGHLRTAAQQLAL
eukprot:9724704-Lingulodinium_polyedra.AAC.1